MKHYVSSRYFHQLTLNDLLLFLTMSNSQTTRTCFTEISPSPFGFKRSAKCRKRVLKGALRPRALAMHAPVSRGNRRSAASSVSVAFQYSTK